MISRERALNIVAGIAVCAAIGMSVAAVRLHLGLRRSAGGSVEAATRQEDWRTYAATGRVIGPANPAATITVFSDFQCPFCARLATELQVLRQRNPDQIAIVFRHSPLRNHPFAMTAAAMAECAGEQGRFEEMHYLLFKEQDSIATRPPSRWRRQLGIADSLGFANCMTDTAKVFASIHRDAAAGQRLGLIGTPLVLINDHRFDGAPDMSTLQRVVDQAIQEHMRRLP